MSPSAPLVSVCLPSLNTFPFLQERIDTILAQTYTRWEMIVVDSYSTDGSWELFQELAKNDSRVSITQAPRGLYESWNNCIERARGKYVYIATSDDTMAPDCLEKLVAALEQYENCDIAQCALRIIAKDGSRYRTWPSEATVFRHGMEGLLERPHLRRAPYDGLLHLTGAMVHLSITQVLARRTLFFNIGGFDARWGAMGDRNWEIKAGLVSNTVYRPDTWATWRIYDTHASASMSVQSRAYARNINEMIDDATCQCEPYLPPELVVGLKEHWLGASLKMRDYYAGLRERPSEIRRRLFQIAETVRNRSARSELLRRLLGKPGWMEAAPREIQNWLESLGLGPTIILLDECPSGERSCTAHQA